MQAKRVLIFAAVYAFGFAACAQREQLAIAIQSAPEEAPVLAPPQHAEVELFIASEDVGMLSSVVALGESEQRAIYFYDTPELDLLLKGVLLRARKMSDGSADSAVVSRFTRDQHRDSEARLRCAQEGTSNKSVCAFRREIDSEKIDAVAEATSDIDRLFSKAQTAFAGRVAPGIEINSLTVFGPVQGRVWKPEVKEIDGSVTVEEWMLPNGASVVTISAKTTVEEAPTTLADLRRFLSDHGIREVANPGTKAGAALDYFASTL